MTDKVNKRKKASNEEMCVRHKKDRSKLYSKRSSLKKKLSNSNLKAKDISSLEKRISKLDSRIYKVNAKLFKCGKKYAKLKKARVSLLRKISRLKNELKKNHEMPYKERNKILGQIKELGNEARNLGIAMGMDLVEQKTGEITFEYDSSKEISSESVTIWEARERVVSLIETGRFDAILIDGDLYDLSLNKYGALFSLDDYITDITSSQKSSAVKTPMLTITDDRKNRLIKIW